MCFAPTNTTHDANNKRVSTEFLNSYITAESSICIDGHPLIPTFTDFFTSSKIYPRLSTVLWLTNWHVRSSILKIHPMTDVFCQTKPNHCSEFPQWTNPEMINWHFYIVAFTSAENMKFTGWRFKMMDFIHQIHYLNWTIKLTLEHYR